MALDSKDIGTCMVKPGSFHPWRVIDQSPTLYASTPGVGSTNTGPCVPEPFTVSRRMVGPGLPILRALNLRGFYYQAR